MMNAEDSEEARRGRRDKRLLMTDNIMKLELNIFDEMQLVKQLTTAVETKY